MAQDLGRHHEVVGALQEALAAAPVSLDQMLRGRLCFGIAQSALALKSTDLVVQSLADASRHGYPQDRILNLRALLARSRGDIPTALACLTTAARDSPGDVRLLFDRSQCFVVLTRYEQAGRDLSRALLLRPSSVPFLYHRACASMELQQWKAARCDLEAAVKASGKRECMYEADLWEGSKFLTGTTEPPPFTCDCWLRLGCMRARDGLWAEALQALQTAAAAEPGNAEVLYELAAALQKLGRYQEAAAAFSAVLARYPRDAVVLMQRGLVLHALKHYEEAAADMEAAKKLQPENARYCVDYRCVDMRRAALTEPGDWAKHKYE